MPDEGLYRRPLPPELVAFTSPEGRVLFREALAEGHLEGWFALSEQFHTQADPAFCGLGTLVVALNALGIDPGRVWKGPWRWYSEELLDCCLPLESIRARGVTLGQFACLARCNGATALVRRADTSTLDELRRDLEEACAAPAGVVVAASYSRRALGQTGDGHFSPVAGLHAARDLALVLDVARFKYPPHWASLRALYDAMREIDAVTGHPRGWVVLRRRVSSGASLLSRLADPRAPWLEAARALLLDLSRSLEQTPARDVDELLQRVSSLLSQRFAALAAPLARAGDAPDAERELHARLRSAIEATPLFGRVVASQPALDPARALGVAALTLALPDAALPTLSPSVRDALDAARASADPALQRELGDLREQLAALMELAAPTDPEPAPCRAPPGILSPDE
ncbi:MAG: phytochelatin synthase family protein [Polyangiaceae bacterium]|nr:phytochelatin synthase family protein [Polyangiaceae bacterium]